MMTREQQQELINLSEEFETDLAYCNTLEAVAARIKSKEYYSSAEAFYLKQVELKIKDLREYLSNRR